MIWFLKHFVKKGVNSGVGDLPMGSWRMPETADMLDAECGMEKGCVMEEYDPEVIYQTKYTLWALVFSKLTKSDTGGNYLSTND